MIFFTKQKLKFEISTIPQLNTIKRNTFVALFLANTNLHPFLTSHTQPLPGSVLLFHSEHNLHCSVINPNSKLQNN